MSRWGGISEQPLTDAEAQALFAVGRDQAGKEGLAVLLMLGHDLATEEVIALRWDAITDGQLAAEAGTWPLSPVVVDSLSRYERKHPTWVFPGRTGSTHCSRDAVGSWVTALGEKAGIDHVNPLRLRKTLLFRTSPSRTPAAIGPDLGGRLRAARLRAGFRTMQQLAGRASVSVSMVGQIERGTCRPGPEVAAKLVELLGLDDHSARELLDAGGAQQHAPWLPKVRLTCRGVTAEDLIAAGYEPQPWLKKPHHAKSCSREWIGSEAEAAWLVTRVGDTFVCHPCRGDAMRFKGEPKARAATGIRSSKSLKPRPGRAPAPGSVTLNGLYGEMLRKGRDSRHEGETPEERTQRFLDRAAARKPQSKPQAMTPKRWAAEWSRSRTHVGLCPRCGTLTFQRDKVRRRVGRLPVRHGLPCTAKEGRSSRHGEEVLTRWVGWAVLHRLGGVPLSTLARQDDFAHDGVVSTGIGRVMELLPDPAWIPRQYRRYVEALLREG